MGLGNATHFSQRGQQDQRNEVKINMMCAGKYNPFEVAEVLVLRITVAGMSPEREAGSNHGET